MSVDRDRPLREQLVGLLRGGHAHMPFDAAVAGFPAALVNARPPSVGYTFWHLLEHLRLAQADILEYLTSAAYRERAWPDEYWPAPGATATEQDWDESVAAFRRDLVAIVAIVADEGTDLRGAVPSNPAHTVLREALLVADHNAYHVGELAILRQVAGAWGDRHGA